MAIFLILEERYTGEDHSGRDTYEMAYDPECDPGYFTTREAAQAWIDRRTEDAEARYQTALRKWQADLREWEAKKAQIVAENERYAAFARENNLHRPPTTQVPLRPAEPNRRNYGEVYEIHEIEQEG